MGPAPSIKLDTSSYGLLKELNYNSHFEIQSLPNKSIFRNTQFIVIAWELRVDEPANFFVLIFGRYL